ncbi:MAG: hypothetical protein R6U35_02730 [Candidatus Humimicrobiaceae bacterium]
MEQKNVYSEETFAYFNYDDIKIETTSVIDVEIKNCNLYLDIYGNLVILGELKNTSSTSKTDLEITFDFYSRDGEKIFSDVRESKIENLYPKEKTPFYFLLKEKSIYIDIARVKIGLNYSNFYKGFEGNPVVREEKYYYEDNFLIIEGELVNLSQNRIEDIILLCTFYDKFGKVAFIKQCYIPRKELSSLGREKFSLKLMLDEYLPEFSSYSFSVSYKDALKVKA